MLLIWFNLGGPEFFGANVTSVKPPISKLKFALSGNPPPQVTWGLKKNETNRSTQRVSRGGEEWYIHDYSLNYTEEICGRMLYFKAEIPDRNSLNWEQKHDVTCKCVYDQLNTAWIFPKFKYLADRHYIVLVNMSLLGLLSCESFLENTPFLIIRAVLKTEVCFCVFVKKAIFNELSVLNY